MCQSVVKHDKVRVPHHRVSFQQAKLDEVSFLIQLVTFVFSFIPPLESIWSEQTVQIVSVVKRT